MLGDATHDPSAYRAATERDAADWDAWQRLAAVSHGQLLNPFGATSGR